MVMAVGLAAGVPVFLWWAREWGANTMVFHPQTSIIAAGIGAALLAAVAGAVVVGTRMAGYWDGDAADSRASESDEPNSAEPDSHGAVATDPNAEVDIGQVGVAESSGGSRETAILADPTDILADRGSRVERDTADLADSTADPPKGSAIWAVPDAMEGSGGGVDSEPSDEIVGPGPLDEDSDLEPLGEDSDASTVTAESIIAAWEAYRRDGDGFFTAAGLQQILREHGLAVTVHDGSRVDAGGDVLVVEATDGTEGRFAVVPSFAKSPRAVPEWFNDIGSGALSARTETIYRLAEGKWTEAGYQVVAKGDISEG